MSVKLFDCAGDQTLLQNELGVLRLDSTRDAGENDSFGVVVCTARYVSPEVGYGTGSPGKDTTQLVDVGIDQYKTNQFE